MQVQASDDGEPRALLLGKEWRPVSLARRPWRIDQHWWRDRPLSRMYYHIAPEDGPPLTIFRDLSSGEWFRQEF